MEKYIKRVATLCRYAGPIVVMRMVDILPVILSVFFVASFGKHELAASALAGVTFVTFIAMGGSFFNAIGVLISHGDASDNGQAEEMIDILFNGLGLSVLIGAIGGMVLWHMADILLVFGQDPRLTALTVGYFHFAGWFLLPALVSETIKQCCMAVRKPQIALWMSLGSAGLNVVLAYVLILGKWGFPAMALSGAMCAPLLATSVMLLVMVCATWVSAHIRPYWSVLKTFNWVRCKQIIRLGVPISIQAGGELIAWSVITFFMGWFGADALAASQIVNQYVIIIVMFYIGLSQAISLIASRAYAQNDDSLIVAYMQTAVSLLSLAFIFISVLFLCCPVMLVGVFLESTHPHHDQIVALARIFFIIVIFTGYFDGVRFVLTGVYRGLHDTKTPMYVGIVCLWGVGITMSYLLGIHWHYGPAGLNLGISLSIACAVAYLLYHFYRHKLPSHHLV